MALDVHQPLALAEPSQQPAGKALAYAVRVAEGLNAVW
jgi:hypothetical protein